MQRGGDAEGDRRAGFEDAAQFRQGVDAIREELKRLLAIGHVEAVIREGQGGGIGLDPAGVDPGLRRLAAGDGEHSAELEVR